jgi:site-specific DNA recombinase
MTRCLGYIRVSTQDQATDGYSLGEQRQRISAAATARGWDLDDIFEDGGRSGSDMDRPGLAAALARLAAGEAEVLIVAKLDRLSRSLADFASLVRISEVEGWGVVALDLGVDTTTPLGQLVRNIVASFAQFERDLIRERTMAGRLEKARAGEGWISGRPPYGYRVKGGTLEPFPDEAHVVQFIFRKSANGMMRRKVARILNEEQVPPPQGDAWTDGAVRRVLRRTVYRGDYEHAGHTVRVPAIVKWKVWTRAQISWADRKKAAR